MLSLIGPSNMQARLQSNKYRALDVVDYKNLCLNYDKILLEEKSPVGAKPLLNQAYTAICKLPPLTELAIVSLPCHLAPRLLAEAINLDQGTSIATIIANWPLPILCFREILGLQQKDKFLDEMGLDVTVFRGITNRTKKCKMRCLDMRGFTLNWNFTRLIVQMWPLLSLKKSQRNVNKITKMVLTEAKLGRDHRLASEVIPHLVEELLANEMVSHPRFGVQIPRGTHLIVKIDTLEFSTLNSFFIEYLITSCLRQITPLSVQASNVIIKSELNIGDDVMDSLAPFIIFRGQEPELLGLCLENLEDDVFNLMSPSLRKLDQVKSLVLLNCNISLQEGRTRLRTSARCTVTSLLQSFPNLTRLDLSQNSFAGVLPELLDSLNQPLEYLSLRECDLCDRDMEYLSNSRHATSLKELNLSKVCGLFPEDGFAVTTSVLTRCLTKFTNLMIIILERNQLTNARMADLRSAVSSWTQLRSISVAGNILAEEPVIQLVEACCQLRHLQYMHIPYSHNLVEAINMMEHGRRDFQARIQDVLQRNRRTTIKVDIAGLAYAVFDNLN